MESWLLQQFLAPLEPIAAKNTTKKNQRVKTVLQESIAKVVNLRSQDFAMQVISAQASNLQRHQQESTHPGRAHMIPMTQVLAQLATPARSVQLIQCHVKMENTNLQLVNQLVNHAHMVPTVAQLDLLSQVEHATMATSAWVDQSSPSHMITCPEDCVPRDITAQVEQNKSAIKENTHQSLVCLHVPNARQDSTAMTLMEQLIQLNAQPSTTVQPEPRIPSPALKVLTLKYSSQVLRVNYSVQHAQPVTTAQAENSTLLTSATQDTSANQAQQQPTRVRTFVQWASGAKRER